MTPAPSKQVRPIPSPPWARDFVTYGVTGTNGKTSSVYMLAGVLARTGRRVMRIATTGQWVGDEPLPRGAGDFRAFVDNVRIAIERGATAGAFEATSLALSRGYAAHWRFDHALFTNLSPDHLETHGDYEHYLAAKAQLFIHLGPGSVACFNAGDPHALYVAKATPKDVRKVFFHAASRGPAGTQAQLVARSIDVEVGRTRVALEPSPWAEQVGGALEVGMTGAVFGENALGVASLALATGVSGEAVSTGLSETKSVPGRFELVARAPATFVDYAHTPDALERTLSQARALAGDRVLVVVFGCGGDRTPTKRGPMGEIAGRLADVVIVTNDNPRREAPEDIARAVVAGVRAEHPRVQVILDRRQAIAAGLQEAGASGILVVAGKGHESGQRIGGQTLPFDDAQVVRALVGAAVETP